MSETGPIVYWKDAWPLTPGTRVQIPLGSPPDTTRLGDADAKGYATKRPFVEGSHCPVRLVAEDAGFSRRQHGFDSHTGRYASHGPFSLGRVAGLSNQQSGFDPRTGHRVTKYIMLSKLTWWKRWSEKPEASVRSRQSPLSQMQPGVHLDTTSLGDFLLTLNGLVAHSGRAAV